MSIIDVPEKGIPLKLAEDRKLQLENIRYDLHFDLEENLEQLINAKLVVSFSSRVEGKAVALDFKAPNTAIKKISKKGVTIEYKFEKNHIVLPKEYIEHGINEFEIEFVAGDQSLNRNEAYLYTLLVPDRASTLFPCFDQPNLKAVFALSLTVPKDWVALGNGPVKELKKGSKNHYVFEETAPISTYLFAFTAGRFYQETRIISGREMTLFYRETDSIKAQRNFDAIFELHATSLDWMEQYTGIPYPFKKFDFATIPTFQYGGMEHVGAIFYRESSLFLDETATQNQYLGRASLIAHETAHMWFGDLVTMDWFNDVWLKEVFANFMAAKIVHPSFPEINHDLRFLMAHHPSAYSEDRTMGAHPIQQVLNNLNNAGTLYGRIIYQKSPIVMKQLELMIGPEQFRSGLQTYLKEFSFENATWDDLIGILDELSPEDLSDWSQVWVKKEGMPSYKLREGNNTLSIIPVNHSNDFLWKQQSEILLGKDLKFNVVPVKIGSNEAYSVPKAFENPDFIIGHGAHYSYGYFELSQKSIEYLTENQFVLDKMDNPVWRGAIWISLYEALLNGEVASKSFLQLISEQIPLEKDPLLLQLILGYLETTYWQLIIPNERDQWSSSIEGMLWEAISKEEDPKLKLSLFRTYQSISLNPEALQKLYLIWSNEGASLDLTLSENDFLVLAAELIIKGGADENEVLEEQRQRIKNLDRKKRFEFLIPAITSDSLIRDSFFYSLENPVNRQVEPWVAEALGYLNHPLRQNHSVKHITKSLELLEEIQLTGDIFFPKRWISTILSGHRSVEAESKVAAFLENQSEFPDKLKLKVLQSVDYLKRANQYFEKYYLENS